MIVKDAVSEPERDAERFDKALRTLIDNAENDHDIGMRLRAAHDAVLNETGSPPAHIIVGRQTFGMYRTSQWFAMGLRTADPARKDAAESSFLGVPLVEDPTREYAVIAVPVAGWAKPLPPGAVWGEAVVDTAIGNPLTYRGTPIKVAIELAEERAKVEGLTIRIRELSTTNDEATRRLIETTDRARDAEVKVEALGVEIEMARERCRESERVVKLQAEEMAELRATLKARPVAAEGTWARRARVLRDALAAAKRVIEEGR